jgi:hypothetical protein
VNAVLLRPLPWHEPDRAVMIWSRWISFDKTWVAEGEVVDYRKRAQTLAEVAAWSDGQVNITGDGEPERVSAAAVTANLFSTLGVSPRIGRVFTAAEDVPKGPDVVVLGHALGVPGLPVDRHVLRVANRIGIAEGDDPVGVEAQLCKALPDQKWTLASDVQILHGRRICRPKPLCDQCPVREECDYFRMVVSPGVGRGVSASRGGPAKARPAKKTKATRKKHDARSVRKARR